MSFKKVMVFDVETTGLFPKDPSSQLMDCPYILQISWAIYGIEQQQIIKTFNSYVNVSSCVIITPFITKLNGCSRELCNQGMLIQDILKIFYKDFHECCIVAAHNIEFDSKVIKTEFLRNWDEIGIICDCGLSLFNKDYCNAVEVELLCTMVSTIEYCKLPKASGKGYKYPKLKELYQYCFNEEAPKGLHNSMIDVLVCLKCLMKIRFHIEITNDTFKDYVNISTIGTISTQEI